MSSESEFTLRRNELSRALGFPIRAHQQDWGVENSDAARIEEFIQFWKEHPGLTPDQAEDLESLILASADERLLADPRADVAEVLSFVLANAARFPFWFESWLQSPSDGEFPFAEVLRAHLPRSRT